jgi:hypothetical protein
MDAFYVKNPGRWEAEATSKLIKLEDVADSWSLAAQ